MLSGPPHECESPAFNKNLDRLPITRIQRALHDQLIVRYSRVDLVETAEESSCEILPLRRERCRVPCCSSYCISKLRNREPCIGSAVDSSPIYSHTHPSTASRWARMLPRQFIGSGFFSATHPVVSQSMQSARCPKGATSSSDSQKRESGRCAASLRLATV